MIRAALLTADQRIVWDAMVHECDYCVAMPGEVPCSDHDLDIISLADLRAQIEAWRNTSEVAHDPD